MDEIKVRDAFEAYVMEVNDNPIMLDRWPSGSYKHAAVQGQWIGWRERAVREATMQAWQSIETAPKDGSKFMAWNSKEGIIEFFRWQGPDGDRPVGWRDNFIYVYPEADRKITHWMPLPAAPSASTDKGLMMEDEYAEFEIWQDGMCVAGTCGPREHAFADAMHYAMMYGQDGPVEIKEVAP